jgi:hypothetical protein
MIEPKGMTACYRYAASNARNALRPALLEPEEGFEPSTFSITSLTTRVRRVAAGAVSAAQVSASVQPVRF